MHLDIVQIEQRRPNKVVLHRPPAQPEQVTIQLPISKSLANRVLILNWMRRDSLWQSMVADTQDVLDMKTAIAAIVRGQHEVYVGEGGTTYRFLLAAAGVLGLKLRLRGTARLMARPIAGLLAALAQLGVEFDHHAEYVELLGMEYSGITELTVDTSESSQFYTAIQLAVQGAGLPVTVVAKVGGVSESYGKLTDTLLDKLALPKKSEHQLNDEVPWHLALQADWSSAGYFFGWASLLLTPGQTWLFQDLRLDASLPQPDQAIVSMLGYLGLTIEQTEKGIAVGRGGKSPWPATIDFSDCPDLAMTIWVLAAMDRAEITLTGLQTLNQKESERATVLAQTLKQVGVITNEGRAVHNHATLRYESGSSSQSLHLPHAGDHRLAMALSLLAAKGDRLVTFDEPNVVNKSFITYWTEVAKTGMDVHFFEA